MTRPVARVGAPHSGTYLGILLGERREGCLRTVATLARCVESPVEVRLRRILGATDLPAAPAAIRRASRCGVGLTEQLREGTPT
ncbi:hypothetical protein [Verrucosispora sp. WMMC514]|uniref:hypothetical protein n=1 Tax=Verrucosispora sp. WMMC514 TaxID=3015156 RepID=UPI00248B693F|nr:hypothetical protein [Verrucosispora sp. WMMC514]WBB89988.1 hypothetical protein O7597_23845 [Verrucosispora sp. WMMC514]